MSGFHEPDNQASEWRADPVERIPHAVRDESQSIVGFGRTNTLHATFDRIVEVFGREIRVGVDEGDGKIDAYWTLRTLFGPAMIYNYKNGTNYLGADGKKISEIDEWSVGGPPEATAAVVREVTEA